MRKLWYAGAAVASGIILFAASPARADEPAGAPADTTGSAALLPGNSIAPPVGDMLSGAGGYALTQSNAALGQIGNGAATGVGEASQHARDGINRAGRPTNNMHIKVPLDGSAPLAGSNLLQQQEGATRRPPAADVVGSLARPARSLGDDAGFAGNAGFADNGIGGMRVGRGLLGSQAFGQLPLLSNLLPNGQNGLDGTFRDFGGDDSDGQGTVDADERPVANTESTNFAGGMPLLGGLGGALPANGVPAVPGDATGINGLPMGGMTILATRPAAAKPKPAVSPATSSPAPVASPSSSVPATPAASSPASAPASSDAADPRLHEEPVDGEAQHRVFSPGGRPVAGVDPNYK